MLPSTNGDPRPIRPWRRPSYAFAIGLALSCIAAQVAAQEVRTGIVQVTVAEPMGMVSGLTVRSAGRSARTDSTGNARLTLPAGRQIISVTGIGYKPARLTVTVAADT